MKLSQKILAALCVAVLAAVACVKTEKNVEEIPGEEVVLSLCPSGEILEVADEPLSKAGLPDGTLYVVSVYQGAEKYAHGIFSDPSQMSIRLSTGKSFSIQVKAVKAGVTEIASASGVYEGNGLLDNQFHYYASDKTDEALYDNTSDISALESQWLLDTYYGATTLTPTAQTNSVNIMLYHMMHKLTVKVNGFEPTDGSVSFTQSPYLPGTAAITLAPDAAEYSKLAVINTNFEEVISAISGNNDYSRSIAFTAEYTSTVSGEPYTKKLIDAAQVTFRRNRETTLTLNLSHNYLGNITATLTLTVEGDDMDVNEITFSGEIDTDASGTNPTVPVPDAVDLGLSVKWASFNLGASKPEEYGDYYAWGEVAPKAEYTWDNYDWGTGIYDLSKYNSTDGVYFLAPEDDAATSLLGDKWRMPYRAEMDELFHNCTKVFTTQNGVGGFLFTSTVSGYENVSIFLPCTSATPNRGWYWGASLYPNTTCESGYVFDLDGVYFLQVYRPNLQRYNGASIRPVYGERVAVSGVSMSPSLTLDKGDYQLLSVSVVPADASNKSMFWSSSDYSVVSVDWEGEITAVAYGTAVITATSEDGGFTASCTVNVPDPSATTPTVPVPEAVDLGLSVKWASFNLGASKPEEYGDYYAWGETEPKSDYSWSTYKWGNSSTSLTKYNTNNSNGIVDNKTVLDPEDDVAQVKLGGSWRMPTDEDWTELRNNCTWTWTTQNGVKGRLVTASNGNSIFLPAAGFRVNTVFLNEGPDADYWSSSLCSFEMEYGWTLNFYSDEVSRLGTCRWSGQSVRPVTE